MTSTLYRLLTYSKGTAEARENFTTEALAACIALDPRPMEETLRLTGVIPPTLDVSRLTPLTQVYVTGAGFLDLVIRTGRTITLPEIWIEVKVDAPESGKQLANYAVAIDRIDLDKRPQLAVLGPRQLGDSSRVKHIQWQDLWHAAKRNGSWRDFANYLKEIGMADEYNEPIRTREAAALDDARRLLRKLARILLPVAQELKTRWPSASYPLTEGEVRQALANQFNRNGRYTLSNQNQTRATLVFGVGWMDDESWLTVRIEQNAKRGQDRLHIIQRANEGDLPASWMRLLTDSKALRIDRRLASFDDASSMRTWITDRVAELQAAGIFAAVDDLRDSAPVDSEGSGVPDGSPISSTDEGDEP